MWPHKCIQTSTLSIIKLGILLLDSMRTNTDVCSVLYCIYLTVLVWLCLMQWQHCIQQQHFATSTSLCFHNICNLSALTWQRGGETWSWRHDGMRVKWGLHAATKATFKTATNHSKDIEQGGQMVKLTQIKKLTGDQMTCCLWTSCLPVLSQRQMQSQEKQQSICHPQWITQSPELRITNKTVTLFWPQIIVPLFGHLV